MAKTQAKDRIRLSNGDVKTLGEALDDGDLYIKRVDVPGRKTAIYRACEMTSDLCWDIGEKLFSSRTTRSTTKRSGTPKRHRIKNIRRVAKRRRGYGVMRRHFAATHSLYETKVEALLRGEHVQVSSAERERLEADDRISDGLRGHGGWVYLA